MVLVSLTRDDPAVRAGSMGGMLLARATGDPAYSDWILQSCRLVLTDAVVP
jgi:hypothetical protein